MAVRNDITVDWSVSPRIITINAPSIEITMQDLYDTMRTIETTQMDENFIISGAGKEPLGGGVVVGLTLSLNDALLAFEARSGPTYIQCRIAGGNLVAFNANGDALESAIYPTAFTQVVQANSSSATLQELVAIQFASYNGGITIDEINGKVGTDYDIGTPTNPAKDYDSAVAVQASQGLPKIIYVIKDTAITSATPPLKYYTFIGEGMDRTQIDIADVADVENCAYYDAHVTGTLDGNSRLSGCVIDNLNYIKGYIESCVLTAGVITLAGSETAHFLDCWSGVPGTETPIINMGGSGQSLAIRGYNGGITLRNKTGTEAVSIDLASGQAILENTVTNGQIVCRGEGKLIDENGDHIPTGTWNGATIINETSAYKFYLLEQGINDVPTAAETWTHLITGADGLDAEEVLLKAMKKAKQAANKL